MATVKRTKNGSNGHDPDGKFAKGNSVGVQFQPGNPGGPGRPPGIDFRHVVRQHAKRTGIPVEQAVCEVYEALRKAAGNGDVQACKLLLDRLCDVEPIALHLTTEDQGPQPPFDLQAWGAKLAAAVLATNGHSNGAAGRT